MHEILGSEGYDKANEFTGTITARTEYATGCVYLLLESCDTNGNPIEHWTDEARVHVLSKSSGLRLTK